MGGGGGGFPILSFLLNGGGAESGNAQGPIRLDKADALHYRPGASHGRRELVSCTERIA